MELTPEEELSTAVRAVLEMFKLGRKVELTDEDRRSIGAALRHAAWESRSELRYTGPQGALIIDRMQEMAELIGGPVSAAEKSLSDRFKAELQDFLDSFPSGSWAQPM